MIEDFDRHEGRADVVQQRGAGQAALVLVAHAEMLGEGHREAGGEQAMPVAAIVMRADRGQPFPQRGALDRLQDGVLRLHHVVDRQGNSGRQLLEDVHHHLVGRGDPLGEVLAWCWPRCLPLNSGKRHGCAAECRRDRRAARWCRWRRAPRPASSRDATCRPARTVSAPVDMPVPSSLRRICCTLSAERRLMSTTTPERSLAGFLRNVRGRDDLDVGDIGQNDGQFLAMIGPVRCKKQTPFRGSLFEYGRHKSSRALRRSDQLIPTKRFPEIKAHS